jgi:uncharacterized protein (DUF1330 family)
MRSSWWSMAERQVLLSERPFSAANCGARDVYSRERITFTLKGDTMKKGYWVVTYRSISDESAVKSYGALALPAIESFGGRFLTRSTSQIQAHEAGLQQRTIVVEFDSYDRALAAHDSEAYQKALQALGSGAERDFRIVEGA